MKTIRIKTTDEILNVTIEHETYNLLFVTDQYGRYLRLRRKDIEFI